jgi:hypothetical protein
MFEYNIAHWGRCCTCPKGWLYCVRIHISWYVHRIYITYAFIICFYVCIYMYVRVLRDESIAYVFTSAGTYIRFMLYMLLWICFFMSIFMYVRVLKDGSIAYVFTSAGTYIEFILRMLLLFAFMYVFICMYGFWGMNLLRTYSHQLVRTSDLYYICFYEFAFLCIFSCMYES